MCDKVPNHSSGFLQDSSEGTPPTPPSIPSFDAVTYPVHEVGASLVTSNGDSASIDPIEVSAIPDPATEVAEPSTKELSPVAGSSNFHPADPSVKNELSIDCELFEKVLELGFEEPLVLLAFSRTKGEGGVEAVVNWILERCNDSDLESESDEKTMGGTLSSWPNGQSHKMVFVVNMSLKMRTGKIAAQVGHATLGVYRLAQRTEQGQQALAAWQGFGEMKVVVKGDSTEQLLDLFKQAKDTGLFAYIVSDAGRTQIPAGSRTVLGIFGPSEVVDTVTGDMKLL